MARFWEEPLGQIERAPSLLLRDKDSVVPFHARASELEPLKRWCEAPAAPAAPAALSMRPGRSVGGTCLEPMTSCV